MMPKRLVGALATIWIGALAVADARAATEGERTAETLRQLERDWADAEKASDSEMMGRIVADDWTGVDNDGRKLTKQQLIALIKSGKGKTESVELGPMDVKVWGDAAVVQGSDIEIGTDERQTHEHANHLDGCFRQPRRQMALCTIPIRQGPIPRGRDGFEAAIWGHLRPTTALASRYTAWPGFA